MMLDRQNEFHWLGTVGAQRERLWTRSVRLAKAKVAGSNPVFRSNCKGPALLRNLKGPGPSFFALGERLDPSWTPREQFRAGDDLGLERVGENAGRFAQRLHGLAEIAHVQVPVGVDGEPDVRVPRDPLDDLHRELTTSSRRTWLLRRVASHRSSASRVAARHPAHGGRAHAE